MPKSAPIHRPPTAKAKTHTVGPSKQKRRLLHTGSRAWLLIRQDVLQRDGFTCAHCKCYGDQVDHIDGNSHNNVLDNLQVLCIVCHGRKTRQDQAGGHVQS